MEYAVVTKAVSTIYECPLDTMEAKGEVISAVSDEALSGMLLVVTGKETEGYLPIRTFYGYTGYISSKDVRLFGREAAEAWGDGRILCGCGISSQSTGSTSGQSFPGKYRTGAPLGIRGSRLGKDTPCR